MPIYVYSCDNNHVLEKFSAKIHTRQRRFRCKDCGLFMRRDIIREHSGRRNETISNHDNSPASHLFSKVRSFKGFVTDSLTPEPVKVTSKAQYDKLLKDTKSAEKTTGYNGG